MGPGKQSPSLGRQCEKDGILFGMRPYMSIFLPPPASSSDVAFNVLWRTIRMAGFSPDPSDGFYRVQTFFFCLSIHSIGNASGYMGDLKKSN